MDYEGALISKILSEHCMDEVLDQNLHPEVFVTHKELWSWIGTTYMDHGDTPPVELAKQRFPSFTFEAVDTSVSFLSEELRKRHTHTLIATSMGEMAKLLKANDPWGALDAMRDTTLKADNSARPSRDVNLAENATRRFKEYRDIVDKGGMVGLPSPWMPLDEVTQGFQEQELIMIAARGGVGKCVEANSLIVDPVTGIEHTIEDVFKSYQLGVLSWSESGGVSPEVLSDKVDTGFKQCFRFELETGRSITVTPEHPFLTPDGWKAATELALNDYVGIPTRIPSPQSPVRMRQAEVDMLSLLLSNGHYTGNRIGFLSADSVFVGLARSAGHEIGVKMVRKSTYDYAFVAKGVPAGRHTRNEARELLQRVGIAKTLANNKVIPDAVFMLPDDQLARFLSLFWMAVGDIDKSAPAITLASQKMVAQIQHLLLRFGIQSSVVSKPVRGGFHFWRLRVYSRCSEEFSRQIALWGYKKSKLASILQARAGLIPNRNIGGPRCGNALPQYRDVLWVKVHGIFDSGVCKIYDLSVGATSCFLANDIIVHNTWAEVIMSCFHHKMGITPILFSREMAVEQIVRRYDAVNARVAHKRLRGGMLTTEEEERFKVSLAELESGPSFIVSGDDDGAMGVSGISAKIKKYRPGIVYIDGAYLISDDRKSKAGWEQFKNVCWDLKLLARHTRLPIIITHQFSKEGTGKDGDEDTLKYGDVQMWFDLIVGMYQTEDLRGANEMLFKINKTREGDTKQSWVATWDLEQMDFHTKVVGSASSSNVADAGGTVTAEGTDRMEY